MKEEFCSLYREIVESGDERKMQMLGSVVKKMMNRYIDNNPTQAREYLDLLAATRWNNYLTQKEANDIVQLMSPKPRWTYGEWLRRIDGDKTFAKSNAPMYNEWALYATMCMLSSDSGKTFDKIFDTDEDRFNACYLLAIDKLTDEDGVFCIRKYFDV